MARLQRELGAPVDAELERETEAWEAVLATRLARLIGTAEKDWEPYLAVTGDGWGLVKNTWLNTKSRIDKVPPIRKLYAICRVFGICPSSLLAPDLGDLRHHKLEQDLKNAFPQLDDDTTQSRVQNAYDWKELAPNVKKRLRQPRVWVLDIPPKADVDEQKAIVAQFANENVLANVTAGMAVGLTGGSTVNLAAKEWCKGRPRTGGFRVYALESNVPLGEDPTVFANDIVKQVAAHFRLKDAFHLHGTNRLLSGQGCDISLVGVGALGNDAPLIAAAKTDEADVEKSELIDADAVTDFLWNLLDINGDPIATSKLNFLGGVERLSVRTVRDEMVRKGRILYALAVGSEKADALCAFLQGRIVNGLIVSAELATAALRVHREQLGSRPSGEDE